MIIESFDIFFPYSILPYFFSNRSLSILVFFNQIVFLNACVRVMQLNLKGIQLKGLKIDLIPLQKTIMGLQTTAHDVCATWLFLPEKE